LLHELDADEVGHRARQRLAVSARDGIAARAALAAAGFEDEPTGDGAFVVFDERAVHRPDDVASVLVAAGCPPTRLVVEGDDLETYFLRLVGAAPPAEGNGDD
jgi:ABC-2 type transport system ATP-binding protein